MATSTKAKVGFFTDDKGNKSSMRLMTNIGFFLIMGVWTIASIKVQVMAPIGFEHVALLGVFVGGKAGQALVEKMK